MRDGGRRSRVARWSLRRRVLVAYAVVLVVALGLGVGGFALALDRILVSRALDAAGAQAEQVAGFVAAGTRSVDRAASGIPSQGSIVQVVSGDRVLDASEEDARSVPLTDARPTAGSSVSFTGVEVPDESGSYVVVARGLPAEADGTSATLVVAAPLEDETGTVQVAAALVAAGAVVLVVVLLVLADRILASALGPVDRIRRQVAVISRAGSGERVSVPESGDEIAELAATMNGMLERLDRSDAATRRFVSDASHELRSPVATIRATVETAPGTPGPEQEVLHAEVLRLHRLVDDLLLLARADDRGLSLRREPVDLDDVVGAEVRRVRSLRAPLDVSGIRAARVEGDADRLGQVLRNLVDNALRHGEGRIRIGMEEVGRQVLVHVDNEGQPIPESRREVVFERFTRVDESRVRSAGGSGLGLSIARTLAEAHEGSVRADEAPDGWCRFTVALPLAARP